MRGRDNHCKEKYMSETTKIDWSPPMPDDQMAPPINLYKPS